MKFNLIDSVTELTDTRIVATKHVSLAEEYLADHFPTFPVLPGVMMLEAATQAAGWLMHHRTGFGKSMAVLKEARNVKYGHFVAPGHYLKLDVQYSAGTDAGATFKVTGTVDQHQALQAKLELAYFNLGERLPDRPGLDEKLSGHTRARWGLLWLATTSTVAV